MSTPAWKIAEIWLIPTPGFHESGHVGSDPGSIDVRIMVPDGMPPDSAKTMVMEALLGIVESHLDGTISEFRG